MCAGNLITDKYNIACTINEFFTGIGRQIGDSLSDSDEDVNSYLLGNYVSSCYFHPVTDQEVYGEIMSLKNKKCVQSVIPVKVIKSIADIISPCLSCLFNNCLVEGKFPDILKIARVVPIFN